MTWIFQHIFYFSIFYLLENKNYCVPKYMFIKEILIKFAQITDVGKAQLMHAGRQQVVPVHLGKSVVSYLVWVRSESPWLLNLSSLDPLFQLGGQLLDLVLVELFSLVGLVLADL